MTRQLRLLFLFLACFGSATAFASFPIESIPVSTRTEVITLETTLTFPFTPAAWPVGAGLAAGEYRAERENAEGIFYRGPNRSVLVRGLEGKTSEKKYALMVGGFWMPKGQSDPKPKLYFFVEPSFPSVADVADLTTPVPAPSTGKPASGDGFQISGASVAGGVVGGVIVDAFLKASITGNEGKLNFWWMPMNDKAFIEALSSAYQKGLAGASR
jgi:hypothetical protein